MAEQSCNSGSNSDPKMELISKMGVRKILRESKYATLVLPYSQGDKVTDIRVTSKS